MQNATLLMFMSHQSRKNGNIFHHLFVSVVCSCSVHVLDVAALIHIVCSGRVATFNDCIHMHLVPYLKSQITPSANDEMIKITPPSRHRIRNSSPGGLRPSTLPLMEALVLHPILTSDLLCFSET